MKITDEIIDYVSSLARLDLNSEEKTKIKGEIEKIIDYMDVLNTLDTSDVEPMSHVLPTTNVFREDVALPSADRDEILKNAPALTLSTVRSALFCGRKEKRRWLVPMKFRNRSMKDRRPLRWPVFLTV